MTQPGESNSAYSDNPHMRVEGCWIRLNPTVSGAAFEQLPGELVLGGVLHLRGFTPETGAFVKCNFIADDNVEPGHIVIERMPPFTDK